MREKRKSGKSSSTKQIRKWISPSLAQSASVLLMWTKTKALPFSLLSQNVTRVVTSYLSSPVLLPGVYEGRLYVVNVQSREYRSVPVSAADCGFFSIDNVTAICMRKEQNRWNASWLDLATLVFTPLPSHPFDYCIPIVCYASRTLFFFQGSDQDSEKYEIDQCKWTKLLNIHIYCDLRFAFVVSKSIYIGIRGDPMCYRVFDLISEQLAPAISLIPSPKLHTFNSIIVKSDDKVLSLSYDWTRQMVDLWSWDYHKRIIQLTPGNKVYWKCPYTSTFTIRIGKELYWLDKDRPEVHSFDMGKMTRQWRKLELAE